MTSSAKAGDGACDGIVVSSGSAGCVLAARLSAKGRRVLLLGLAEPSGSSALSLLPGNGWMERGTGISSLMTSHNLTPSQACF
jgi:succinate dehydrogenase/fumarate reductase flavoprotein subunit